MFAIPRSSARPSGYGRSIPAPVRGWNARDPVAAMHPTDAIFLDNFFPEAGGVRLRPGSLEFAEIPEDDYDSIVPDPHNIRSLMSYSAPDGSRNLFAAAEDGIYDVTAGGQQLVISTPATHNEWQYVNLTTAGGSFLWCCNGVDQARHWNGTAWTLLDDTGGSPNISGIVSTDITNAHVFKSRLYVTCKDSLSFWFFGVNSVQGAASEFPLGVIFKRGGHLVAIDSWTLDGGDGPDDYLALITSEGELAIYRGTDPANAATWALQGVYYIGAPLSPRCFVRLGGDLAVLTVRGLYPLSKALLSASIDMKSAFTDRIAMAWTAFVEQGKHLFGWEAHVYPSGPFLLVNVPTVNDTTFNAMYSYQFVMNLETGAWCRFLGMSAECWAVHDGELYFGRHNKVYKAWSGESDVGFPVDGRVKTAFFYPSGRGNLSRVTLIRPIFVTTSTDVKLQLGIDSDFDETALSGSSITFRQTASLWDVAKWDEAVWTASSVQAKWRTVAHIPGRAIALRLRILGKGITMYWNATDFILQKGGML